MVKQYGPYRLQKSFSVITVPKQVRDKLHLKPGDLAVWLVDNKGRCILRKVTIKEVES
jgi:AbrB family looped-hinge helix DNA binding protein